MVFWLIVCHFVVRIDVRFFFMVVLVLVGKGLYFYYCIL
jgi:hypothetical protein